MRRAAVLFLGLAITLPALSSPWGFGPVIPVSRSGGERVFHHLESSGRRNIAVSGDAVAVAWEDNRDGTPRIYAAFSGTGASGFGNERRISGGGEAYEPAIVPLGDGRFLCGWEEDGRPWLRIVSADGSGPATPLSKAPGVQVSLAARGDERAYAVWTSREQRIPRVRFATVGIGRDDAISVGNPCSPDPAEPAAAQSYAAVTATGSGGVLVAWEDRRPGHTVIMVAHRESACRFSGPRRLNELLPPRSALYGRGSGVARVSLAEFGGNGILAAWADKRDFTKGYSIYAAISTDGGYSFGPNELVQDEFADLTEQWHPAAAGDRSGMQAVAWDDNRDQSSDIWLTWRTGEGWSEDLPVPGASGKGEQTHPAITLDSRGDLHIAWTSREHPGGATRLFYARGARTPPPKGGPE